MRFACPALAACAAILAACGDDPVVIPIDRIVHFVPERLDFGMSSVGDQKEMTAKLESTGGDRLQIRDVGFDPDVDVFLPRRESGGALRGSYLSPAEPIDLVVTWEPQLAGPNDAKMIVVFDGGNAELPLFGDAFLLAPARAVAEPMSILFTPAIELGRRVVHTILVRNAGEKAGSVVVVSAQAPFAVTEVGGAPVSADVLMPNESRTYEVAFAPTSIGMFQKTIKIALEDSTPAEIGVSGEGVVGGTLNCTPGMLSFGGVERGEVRDLPLDCTVSGGVYTVSSISTDNNTFAVIAGSPGTDARITDLHLTVRFTASGVAATGGRPVGGMLAINAASGPATMIALDGRVSAPLPMGTDLKVTMDWAAGGTDFDLHLVQNGHLPFETGFDCFWDDTHLDWGTLDDPDDDPYLDKDARSGVGPEEINLGHATGIYDVWVQYFGGPMIEPNVAVRVDYWLKGMQGTTQMRSMAVCGHTWRVGRLDFSTNTPTFTPDGGEVDTWIGRATGCQQ